MINSKINVSLTGLFVSNAVLVKLLDPNNVNQHYNIPSFAVMYCLKKRY